MRRHLSPARRDRGASAVEYGLLLAAVAAVLAGVVWTFGAQVGSLFDGTAECLAGRVNGCPTQPVATPTPSETE